MSSSDKTVSLILRIPCAAMGFRGEMDCGTLRNDHEQEGSDWRSPLRVWIHEGPQPAGGAVQGGLWEPADEGIQRGVPGLSAASAGRGCEPPIA